MTTTRGNRLIQVCTQCGNREFKRVWGAAFHRSMETHFNRSVGQVIGNNRQFTEALKKKGHEYEQRTGMECDYQPIERDPTSMGVTAEGLTGKAAEWAAKSNSDGAAPKLPPLPKRVNEQMHKAARAYAQERERLARSQVVTPAEPKSLDLPGER